MDQSWFAGDRRIAARGRQITLTARQRFLRMASPQKKSAAPVTAWLIGRSPLAVFETAACSPQCGTSRVTPSSRRVRRSSPTRTARCRSARARRSRSPTLSPSCSRRQKSVPATGSWRSARALDMPPRSRHNSPPKSAPSSATRAWSPRPSTDSTGSVTEISAYGTPTGRRAGRVAANSTPS